MRAFAAVIFTVIYTAAALAANAGPAGADTGALAGLRTGDMKKLDLHEAAAPLPEAALVTLDDAPAALADYRGRWVLANFWATWCAPCRQEMPSLDRLQALMPDLAVVPVATGRNPPEAIRRFFDEAGIGNLAVLRDPQSELARQMGILALPVTVILNPEGEEVARLIGDAEWDSEDARAILAALMKEE